MPRYPQRVLLVHPGVNGSPVGRYYPPWGILCVAEHLRRAGIEVRVADLNGEPMVTAMSDALARHEPTIVGFTGKMGLAAHRLRQAIDTVLEHDRSLPIAVGGPLVSSFPDRRKELWSGVRAVFLGDGERAFTEWVIAGCPEGSFRGKDTVDLDVAGIPSFWDELREYVWPPGHFRNMRVPSVHVASSRGCTGGCRFCYLSNPHQGRRFRWISTERLFEDLDRLSERFGARGFYFVDDCFLDTRRCRLAEIERAQARRGSPYRFGCDVQLRDLDDLDNLGRMHRAGFRCIYVGIEAASARVRSRLGKTRLQRDVGDAVERVMSMGFRVHASIGMGWPGERAREMEETLALIDRLPELPFDAFSYHPLPSVPLTSEARASFGVPTPDPRSEPYEDYCEHIWNYSSIPNERFQEYWVKLIARRNERYKRLCGFSLPGPPSLPSPSRKTRRPRCQA